MTGRDGPAAFSPHDSTEEVMEKKDVKPEPRKVLVRKLEKLETTVLIITDPGCRDATCG
jgi:hypothetical protein